MAKRKLKGNLKFGLVPLKKDKHDFPLGAVFPQMDIKDILPKFELPRISPLHQKESDYCSAYGTDQMSRFQEDEEFEPSWGFAVSKLLSGDPDEWGQNLRDAFKRPVKYGSLRKADSPMSLETHDATFLRHIKNWPKDLFDKALPYKKQSYFFIDGRYDPFDNICVALYQFRDQERAVGSGVLWDWPMDNPNIPSRVPTSGFGHFIVYTGYDREKDCLVLLNSYGPDVGDKGYFYIPRSVVNAFAGKYGAGMFVDLPAATAKMIINVHKKESNMAEVRSDFMNLNLKDVAKGALVAVIVAVLGYSKELIEVNGLAITADQFREILSIALTAGVGYLVKNLFEDNTGKNKIISSVGGLFKK